MRIRAIFSDHLLCHALYRLTILFACFWCGEFLPVVKADQADKSANMPNTVVYASLDHARAAFVTGGFKRAFSGAIEHSGFYVEAQFGLGAEQRKRAVQSRVDIAQSIWRGVSQYETSFQANAALGYQWMTGQGVVSGTIGAQIRTDEDAARTLHSKKADNIGVRATAELWHHPTSDTLIQLNVVSASLKNSLWARASFGYAIFEQYAIFSDSPMLSMFKNAFIGPEISLYHEPQIGSNYTKTRFGASIANVKIYNLQNTLTQISLSGGFESDTDRQRGIYCNVGFSQKW